jgi:hypothetical protein
MSEDNLHLLFCYLIFGLTLAILTFRSNNRQKTLIINLLLSAFYSGILLYNLIFNGSGGSALLWLVALMFFIGLHWIINLIGIVLTYRK